MVSVFPEVSGDLDVNEATKRLRRGLTYWARKAEIRACGMPTRSDIDPSDIPDLLPYIVLVHVSWEPLDFIERITGDQVIAHSHANSMGISWRAFPGRGPGSALWRHNEAVVTTHAPVAEHIPYVGPQKDFKEAQVISCPLSDDGERVNKILSFVDYVRRQDGQPD